MVQKKNEKFFMTGSRILILLAIVLHFSCTSVEQDQPVIKRVAFGSCLKIEHSSEELWHSILSSRPNLFIFAGDNVYADSREAQTLYRYYGKLEDDSGFQRLKTMVPLLAVYDDHDYGISDGGKENPLKEVAAKACLDFFDVPLSDPRRSHEGVYGSYTYGPKGKRLQIILLDTRYFRDALVKTSELGKRYAPNKDPKATMLGLDQWAWLDKTLQEEADVRLIVSSIQVVPDKRGMESWGNFPFERKKLFDLISKNKANGVIFVSGDAHFSEASRYADGPYPIYDITSSAMGHHHNSKDGKPTKYSSFPNEYRLTGSDYTAANFGLVKIDWKGPETEIQLELKAVSGKPYFTRIIKLKDLQVKK